MIVVRPDGKRIVVTEHATARFRSRAGVSAGDIADAVRAAEVRSTRPSGVDLSMSRAGLRAAAWLVTKEWACPLHPPDPRDLNYADFDYCAPTVLRRRRRSKAEVRALREQAAEDRQVA